MKEAKDVVRVVGIVLLSLFLLIVGVPLVFKLAGITFAILSVATWLAILVIKIAVTLAIIYLILFGIRKMLR